MKLKQRDQAKRKINLFITTLTVAQKSLLMKGPSFFPTPSDVNWCKMRKDFHKFDNQLRFTARNILEQNANTTNDVTTNTGINALKKPQSNIAPLYRTRKTKYKSLERFIENEEKEVFNPENAKITRGNLSKDEKKSNHGMIK